jgi:hypothetical protein
MKRVMVSGLCGLLVCALSIALVNQAVAEITYGRFRFLPEIALRETFRSNIYLTESNRKSDFITTVTPGFGLKYLFGQNSFVLDYRVGFLNFAHYSTNNYQDHRANGFLNLVTQGGLEFTLRDNFVRSTYERAMTMIRQRSYYENSLYATAAYAFTDRWKAEAKYNSDDLAFDSYQDRVYDYTNHLLGSSLYYRLLPRLSGLVEYDYVIRRYVTSTLQDYKGTLVYAGVAFDPAGELKGSFKGGYGWWNFDTDVAGRDNRPQNWIMAVQLTEDFTSRTSLALDALRALSTDVYFRSAAYTNTSAKLAFTHFFTGKIGAGASASYTENAYLDDLREPVTGDLRRRTDKLWTFGIVGIYNIQKWLQTRLEYQYLENDSNFNLNSYVDHRVMFRLVFSL